MFTSSSFYYLSYCVVLYVVPMWDSFPVSLYYCTKYDCAMKIKSYLIYFCCSCPRHIWSVSWLNVVMWFVVTYFGYPVVFFSVRKETKSQEKSTSLPSYQLIWIRVNILSVWKCAQTTNRLSVVRRKPLFSKKNMAEWLHLNVTPEHVFG